MAVLSFSLLLPFAVVLQPEVDRSKIELEEGVFSVASGTVYVMQRGELYDVYLNYEYSSTWTESEYSGDRLEIPIKNRKGRLII